MKVTLILIAVFGLIGCSESGYKGSVPPLPPIDEKREPYQNSSVPVLPVGIEDALNDLGIDDIGFVIVSSSKEGNFNVFRSRDTVEVEAKFPILATDIKKVTPISFVDFTRSHCTIMVLAGAKTLVCRNNIQHVE